MLFHPSLQASLQAISLKRDGVTVHQFRGIPFGRIPKRFAKPEPIPEPGGQGVMDCTQWGPRCPQVKLDVTELLRVPKEEGPEGPIEEEDEFNCLNLTVTTPATQDVSGSKVPVLVWIHGGSQTISFGSASQRCGDPTRLVTDSITQGKPIVVVSMNYRLNIFTFGDGNPDSETNLALDDQKLAVAWVRKHIQGFGGDVENITLGGESAGAVYAHAHMVLGTPVRRGILMSGSLFLSPPLPRERGRAFAERLESMTVESGEQVSLREAKVGTLLEALKKCNAVSMWLHLTDDLQGWPGRMETVASLLIGDVEYESVIWRNGVETMTAAEIDAAFSLVKDADQAKRLRRAYRINPAHTTTNKLGALDFINDLRFAMPAHDMAEKWRKVGRPVHQYLLDQPNPWQASARSHHALDLVLLFGGYDLSHEPHAEGVGKAMRQSWIQFVNGAEPWDVQARMAFGPVGRSEPLIDLKQYGSRRRLRNFDILKEIDSGDITQVFMALAAGKIDLRN